MALWVAVVTALGASLCAATSSTLQHRTAVDVAKRVPSQAVVTSVRATVTHRAWLAAVGLQCAGFTLHASALRFGRLSVVQPLLVCAVLFALPLNRLLRKEPITRRELGWAALLVVGLAGFLTAGAPSGPAAGQAVDVPAAVVVAAVGGLVVAGCAVAATRVARPVAAALLAGASGVLFAGEAALLKASVGLLGHGLGTVLTSWQPYALVVVGLGGVVFSQLAFRSGPLSASLPVSATVNPVLGVPIGALVYNERVRGSVVAVLAECAFLLLLTLSAVVLVRLEQRASQEAHRTVG
ncbi:MAG TPA: DMT family transporter [Pseudonocardiaceae bacterium]|nr:DMT family transporter [Pseudonocardiaceae bacterium]